MTKPLLLVQPLKIDEINIKILEDEEEAVSSQQQQDNKIIDDAEILAILGLSSPLIFDWQQDTVNMPESLPKEDYHNDHKRKHDYCEEEDVFAQLDFEEAHLLYPNASTTMHTAYNDTHKKTKIEYVDSSFSELISA